MNIMKKAVVVALIALVTSGIISVKSLATNVENNNQTKEESNIQKEANQENSNEEVKNEENSEEIEQQNKEENNTDEINQENDEIENSEENNQEENEELKPRKVIKSTKLYSIPSFSSADKKEISENTVVEVNEEINNWIQVSYEGNTGWLLKNKTEEYVEEIKTEEPAQEAKEENNEEQVNEPEEKTINKTEYISVSKANVRAQASKDSAVIASLEEGTEITVVSEIDTWYKIKTDSIKEGYVSKSLVVATKPVSRGEETTREEDTVSKEKNDAANSALGTQTASEQATTTGNSVVEYAKQFVGSKYVSGGSAPETGFDCSGFTSYVFKHFGISIGRSSASQASAGTPVDKANLQPGDLVLYKGSSGSGIGHASIYVGNGQIIHAVNPSKGLIISSMDSSYYAKRYVCARRLVK